MAPVKYSTRARNFPSLDVVMALVAIVTTSLSALAGPKETSFAVDLELVIAVDVSSSMTAAEQRMQREGVRSSLSQPGRPGGDTVGASWKDCGDLFRVGESR